MKPRQNGRHLPHDIFKCIFWNENVRIAIDISLRFVSKSSNNNIPVLVQIMPWRRPGDEPLSEPMLIIFYWRICASPGLNELILQCQVQGRSNCDYISNNYRQLIHIFLHTTNYNLQPKCNYFIEEFLSSIKLSLGFLSSGRTYVRTRNCRLVIY